MEPFIGATHNVWRRGDSFQAAGVATFAFRAFRVDRDMTYFTCQAGSARPEFSIQDDCPADSLTDRDVKKIAAAATGANLEFTIGRGVGVVFQFEAQARGFHEFGVKIIADYARQGSCSQYPICLTVNQTQYVDSDRRDSVCVLT